MIATADHLDATKAAAREAETVALRLAEEWLNAASADPDASGARELAVAAAMIVVSAQEACSTVPAGIVDELETLSVETRRTALEEVARDGIPENFEEWKLRRTADFERACESLLELRVADRRRDVWVRTIEQLRLLDRPLAHTPTIEGTA